mgnify:CR=1 FL=1
MFLLLACATDPELNLSAPADPLSGEVELTLSGNADQLLVLVDGAVLGGGPGPGLTLTWDTTSVDDGPHTLRGQGFIGSQSPFEVLLDVTVEQSAGLPPEVQFLEPEDGAQLEPGLHNVTLDITDDDVDTVDVFVGDELLGALPADGPWELEWDADDGDYTLSVVVTDMDGNEGTDAIDVSVATPTISCVLTRPTTAEVAQGEVGLKAAVTSGTDITSVRFLADDELVADDTESPWQAAWDASEVPLDSVVTLTIVGLDADGNTCQDHHDVTVVDEVDAALEVVITSPANGSTVSGANMPLQVATQSENGIQTVSASVNGELIETLDQAPWKFTIDTTAYDNGPIQVQATALELGTGVEESDLIELNVDN